MRLKRWCGVFLSFAVVATVVVGAPASSAQDAGGTLAQDVTADSPSTGGRVRLENVTAFHASGGEATFEPDTSQAETFTYDSVDSATNELVGVTRPSPASHPAGTFVRSNPSAEATPSPSESLSSEPSPSPSESTTSGTSDVSDTGTTDSDTTTSSGESTTTSTSSADVGDIPDPCVDLNCDEIVRRVLETLVADPCDPYNGGIDCGALIQDVVDSIGAVEPPPDPCDPYNGGVDCNRLIQEALETLAYDPCDPYNGGYDCNAIVQDVLELLFSDPCDPYNGGINCQGIIDSLAQLIPNVCPNGPVACADPYVNLVGNLIDDLYYDVCGGDLSYCQAKYQAMVQALVDSLVAKVCSGGLSTCDDLVYSLIDYVGYVVDDLYYDLCGGDLSYCQAKYQAIVQAVVDSLVIKLCPSGLATCDDMIIGIVNGAVAEASRIVDDLYYDVCGGDLSYCQAKYQAIVQALIDSVVIKICSGGLSTCDDVVIAIVSKTIDDAYYTLCGPNDLSGCQAKYNGLVDELFESVCTSSTSSGSQACVDMIVAIVSKTLDDAYYAICGPNDLSGCQAKYNDMVEALFDSVCHSSYSSGSQACIDMIVAIVSKTLDEAYYAICGPNDLSGCQARYQTMVDTLLNSVCSSTTQSGVNACLDMVTATVNQVIDTYCPRLECPVQTISLIISMLTTQYSALYQQLCSTDPETTCIDKKKQGLIAFAWSLVDTHCPDLACAQTLLDQIEAAAGVLIIPLCGTDILLGCEQKLKDELNALLVDPCYAYLDCEVHFPQDIEQRYPDYIKATGDCANKVVITSLYMPYGVTEKSVDVGHKTDATCSLDLGPIKSIGTPGVPEPHEITSDLEIGGEVEAPDVVPPLAPTDLVASGISPTRVSLTWKDRSTDEDGFTIERSATGAASFQRIATVRTDSTSFVDGALSPATSYDYRVRAFNDAGTSDPSNEASARTFDPPPPPPAATAITATATSASSIRITWTDNATDEEKYEVERSSVAGGPYTHVVTVGPNTAGYHDSSVAAGTTYYYRVLAMNAGGSTASSEAAATTPAAASPPAAPDELVVTGTSETHAVLRWKDRSSDEDGFVVERSDDGGNTYARVARVTTDTTGYSNYGLQPDSTYYYRVRAFNGGGESASSGTVMVRTASPSSPPPAAPERPATPTDLSAVARSVSQIDLAWRDNSVTEDGFRILRGTSSGGPYAVVRTMPSGASTFADTGLASGTQYYYRVVAFNAGGESSHSNEATAATYVDGSRTEVSSEPSYSYTDGGDDMSSATYMNHEGDSTYRRRKCNSAKANFLHTSITIHGWGADDLGWFRSTSRRLWGCRSAWWSERYTKLRIWSGAISNTNSAFWWWYNYKPEYIYVDWGCHPPRECTSLIHKSKAVFEVDGDHPWWVPCPDRDYKIKIWGVSHHFRNGDKNFITKREGHCEGLRYPEDFKTNNEEFRGDYGGDPRRDWTVYADPPD